MNYEEKTVSKKHIYSGNIISVESVNVLLPNGKEASRDVVLHPGASVIIPISDNNELYMVRQYRKPVEKELLELPAGKLDKGEDPEVCARRELKEETGLEAAKLKHISSIYTTPGFTNEVLHIYAAVGLHEGEACADEDEFISTKKVPVNNLVEMILNQEITDAKSIIGILLAEKIIKGEIKI
ncbi:NUDIX domain-containing protein [Acetivibrio mesophilus]|uniref:NUDIX hydrolase n=1 Tax=Acetivibrio mesophilus TaxID=2487273 RepID=A0A4V1K2F4_9FIRM|nr:NUDIX hydrolase [Acetivibrio mesophilus]ODM25486.1 ADP-ribose pyrophosphatase [Clostridium sp. Bc-iso-3]RXE60099.1 NUDIX hydrolase [Acetivibrio mesophilus]HHV29149.1 NUDIX hydrolase [Clostridium sp.]